MFLCCVIPRRASWIDRQLVTGYKLRVAEARTELNKLLGATVYIFL